MLPAVCVPVRPISLFVFTAVISIAFPFSAPALVVILSCSLSEVRFVSATLPKYSIIALLHPLPLRWQPMIAISSRVGLSSRIISQFTQPCSCILYFFGFQRGIVVVGFPDDVLQEPGIRLGRISCWSRRVSALALVQGLGIYLLGNNAPRPYEEYLMVLSFASLANRLAT